MKKIKICGITCEREAEYLNEAGVDFAGMIQFVEKSRRNISLERASSIMKRLDPSILPVAVTVCPEKEQLRRIEEAGFGAVQIHGFIPEMLLDGIRIPVIKAFNVGDLSDYGRFCGDDRVAGFIFDAQTPGSGKTFDWSLLGKIPAGEKPALIAGGIGPDNAVEALTVTGLAGVDVSSGAEGSDGLKSREKILALVRNVRAMEK